jgi:thiamine-monophosphate kinase
VTAIGGQQLDRILYRNGACPGDGIYVTGNLGSAAAVIRALSSSSPDSRAIPPFLLEAYHHPRAHIREGLVLAESGWATSAIDISDGLAADLGHVCKASGAGATIEMENLPVADELRKWMGNDLRAIDSIALAGGEDYILLFTARSDPAKESLTKSRFEDFGGRFWRIGTITQDLAMIAQRAGRVEPIVARGFDHLRDSALR